MTEIRYPFGKTVPEETPVPITPEIVWLRMPLPFVLNHVNIWLIRDREGWCTVDTGATWDKGKAFWEKVLRHYRIVRQVVTHCHPDHAGLSGWLAEKTKAPLWMTQGEYLTALACQYQAGPFSVDATAGLLERHGLDEERLRMLKKRGNAYGKECPSLPPTCHRLFDSDVITIGTHEWKVIVGYGHSVEHASFYCEKLNILIAGDMLLPSISTHVPVVASDPEGDPLQCFLESVGRYCDLPEDTLVLPSHGRPFYGFHSRVNLIKEHHKKRSDALLSACTRPRTACDVLPVLFERNMADIHQWLFAMGESIAHLNYLEKRKKLEKLEKNGRVRFVTIGRGNGTRPDED